MKKTTMITGAVALLTTLVMVGGIHSEATTVYGDLGATPESIIEFTDRTDPGDAVDPGTNEPIVVEPINPSVSDFKIVYASNWNFGKNQSDGKDMTYFSKLDKKIVENKEVPMVPMVSMLDSRGSDRNGWTLSIKQDSPFKDENKHELKGAELVITNAFTMVSDQAPTINKATEKLVLSTTPQEIAKAVGKEIGVGNWGIGFGEATGNTKEDTTTGIQLNVPGSSVKNKTKYSTTITYELTAEPTI